LEFLKNSTSSKLWRWRFQKGRKRVNNWHVNLNLPQKVMKLSGAMGTKSFRII
jgi:hypothetical protein